jgi:hypothetical protein
MNRPARNVGWKGGEIGEGLRAIGYSIPGSCAIVSMSDGWAMYCWEGMAVLGGSTEVVARYGELVGGWKRLCSDCTNHLHGDYAFYNEPGYRAAVERVLSGPNIAWSHAAQT